MKLLLDTHAALWWLAGDSRLSGPAQDAISRAGKEAVISVASVWEVSIKRASGRLEAPELGPAASAAGFGVLTIGERHAELAGQLPLHHRDPFDRMLIAQAICEQLTIITRDPSFRQYPIAVLW